MPSIQLEKFHHDCSELFYYSNQHQRLNSREELIGFSSWRLVRRFIFWIKDWRNKGAETQKVHTHILSILQTMLDDLEKDHFRCYFFYNDYYYERGFWDFGPNSCVEIPTRIYCDLAERVKASPRFHKNIEIQTAAQKIIEIMADNNFLGDTEVNSEQFFCKLRNGINCFKTVQREHNDRNDLKELDAEYIYLQLAPGSSNNENRLKYIKALRERPVLITVKSPRPFGMPTGTSAEEL